jgi:hypothetical protein
MARSKEGKKDEFYLSEIRSLRKENKSLKQRVKQLEKAQHIFEEKLEPEEVEPEQFVSKLQHCKACGKGKLIEFEIMGKCYGTCNVCQERVKLRG